MRISDWSSDMCSSDLDEADSAGDDEGLVGKQRQWQYRFSGSVLDEDEACERHHGDGNHRSEEHTSELQSLMRSSYAVFCLKKKQRILSDSSAARSILQSSSPNHKT